MFYNRGKVISDQFDHFMVIGFNNQDTAQPEGTFLSVIFTGGEKG